jgi:hypothetical protein
MDWDEMSNHNRGLSIDASYQVSFNVIMLSTKNYADQPKTKSVIALTKIIFKICTFSIKNHDFTRKKQ